MNEYMKRTIQKAKNTERFLTIIMRYKVRPVECLNFLTVETMKNRIKKVKNINEHQIF